MSKPPQEWTLNECDAIIQKYTAFNKKGYQQKYSPYSSTDAEIFIEARPLIKPFIQAMVRKEAINKRWSEGAYLESLQDYLETYTNWTLKEGTGEVIAKEAVGGSLLDEYSFMVRFENLSSPYRTIEVDGAYEGFFLENRKGEFTRVIGIAGHDVDEYYFVLMNDLNAILTFAARTDSVKRVEFNEDTYRSFWLVFNGLQSRSIFVRWQ